MLFGIGDAKISYRRGVFGHSSSRPERKDLSLTPPLMKCPPTSLPPRSSQVMTWPLAGRLDKLRCLFYI